MPEKTARTPAAKTAAPLPDTHLFGSLRKASEGGGDAGSEGTGEGRVSTSTSFNLPQPLQLVRPLTRRRIWIDLMLVGRRWDIQFLFAES